MIRRPIERSADREQVANACDWFVSLTPVSELPAALTRANWAALLPDENDSLPDEENCNG